MTVKEIFELRKQGRIEEAMRRNPRDKHNQRYMAVVYTIMGEREKAVDIYHPLM